MTPIPLQKVFLSILGRTPLAAFPQVRFSLSFETTPLEASGLVCSVTLNAAPPKPASGAAEVVATFSLSLDADEYDSEAIEAAASATALELAEKLTPAQINTHAEEIGAPIHCYFFRWNSTDETRNAEDTARVFEFQYTGQIQF